VTDLLGEKIDDPMRIRAIEERLIEAAGETVEVEAV